MNELMSEIESLPDFEGGVEATVNGVRVTGEAALDVIVPVFGAVAVSMGVAFVGCLACFMALWLTGWFKRMSVPNPYTGLKPLRGTVAKVALIICMFAFGVIAVVFGAFAIGFGQVD